MRIVGSPECRNIADDLFEFLEPGCLKSSPCPLSKSTIAELRIQRRIAVNPSYRVTLADVRDMPYVIARNPSYRVNHDRALSLMLKKALPACAKDDKKGRVLAAVRDRAVVEEVLSFCDEIDEELQPCPLGRSEEALVEYLDAVAERFKALRAALCSRGCVTVYDREPCRQFIVDGDGSVEDAAKAMEKLGRCYNIYRGLVRAHVEQAMQRMRKDGRWMSHHELEELREMVDCRARKEASDIAQKLLVQL
jgi:hypothetical protein